MGLTGSSNKSGDCETIKENDILPGTLSKYQIEKFLAQGSFWKVAKCIKLDTQEKVAVRLMRPEVYDTELLTIELLMSREVRKLDPDKNNIAKLGEFFYSSGFHCLVHEMLDMSLGDYMLQRNYKPLRICEIQTIAQQILVALKALGSIGVVHRDISVDNIMLVNHKLQPFKVKLIDFSSSRTLWLLPVMRGKWLQPLFYSAPEVIMGFELTEAVDIWSLGCVLSLVYFGCIIFPEKDINMICAIVMTQGQPSDDSLESGIFTKRFFQKKKKPNSLSSWKLNKDLRAKNVYTDKLKMHPDLKHIFECEDTLSFLRFLKQMLNADPSKRINPSDALKSDFITKQNICRGFNPINGSNLSSIPFCFLRLLWQLDEMLEKFRASIAPRPVRSCTDDALEDGKHRCTRDEPQAKAQAETAAPSTGRTATNRLGKTRSDASATAGTGQRPPDIYKIISLISITHNGDISTREYTTGFVEVKTKRTYLKRIHKLCTSNQGNEQPSGKQP